MRTDEMMNLEYSIKGLQDLLLNMPFSGQNDEINIQRVLFLDLYFRNNLEIELGVYEIDKARELGNYDLEKELKEKYSYAYEDIGIFREKKVSPYCLARFASNFLVKFNIETRILSGYIFDNGKYIKHYFNEVKIGNLWYCYDFTMALISSQYMNKSYAKFLHLVKAPLTQIEYCFTNQASDKILLGGERKINRFESKFDETLLNSDYENYNMMDRTTLAEYYKNVSKFFN